MVKKAAAIKLESVRYATWVVQCAVQKVLLLAALTFLFQHNVSAIGFSDANWVSFGGIPGANDTIEAVAVDGAGNLYIGGKFTVAGNIKANRIAKWDGTNWSELGLGMNDRVKVLAVSGTNLYAAGYFTTATNTGNQAVTVKGIAKWDGSSWSALGSGYSGNGTALAVLGNDVYAGGSFTTADGSAANNIAKWDGTNWSALGSGLDKNARVLAVSDGNIFAGGEFATAGGVAANHIAKWNGSSWSALGSGTTMTVYSLAVSGSNAYVGGDWSINKWDGSSWSVLGWLDGIVNALLVSGTNLYAGGLFTYFTTTGGITVNRITKWNGSSWSPLGSGMDGEVKALAVSGTNLYAGGVFNWASGVTANRIAKWNGSSWSVVGTETNRIVSVLAVSGSDLYTLMGYGVAKWSGSNWSMVGSEMKQWVSALVVAGTNVYLGGSFTIAGGSAGNGIAKWNGSNWSAVGLGVGGDLNYTFVYSLAVAGTNLYAGGRFKTAGGNAAKNIAKWDGTSWSALSSGMDGQVFNLAVLGNDLYAAGDFTTAGGSAVKFIAKWNGSTWSALGAGINSNVSEMVVSGTNLYVGGQFTMATNSGNAVVRVNRIAKWNGSRWSAVGFGMNDAVNAIAVTGSNLYAGGNFTIATNIGNLAVTVNRIAKWDGSSWSAQGSGMDNGVYALAVLGNELFAGGNFSTVGGKVAGYFTKASWAAAPFFTGELLHNGDIRLSLLGGATTDYALDSSCDLSPPIWIPQATNSTDATGELIFTNTPYSGTNNFWRIRAVP